MKNKTKVVRFRVTEHEYGIIKDLAKDNGDTVSEWILRSIFGERSVKIKTEIGKTPMDIKEEQEVIKISPTYIPSIAGTVDIKCQSPDCQSIRTKLYHRSTGNFWLCDTHKP